MTQSDAIDILAAIASVSSVITKDKYFTINDKEYPIITAKLKEYHIEYEDLGDFTIYIKEGFYETNEIKAYHCMHYFFESYEEVSLTVIIFGDKDIDSVVSYKQDSDVFFKHYQSGNDDNTATNYYYLKKIIDLLSCQKITSYKDTLYDRYFFLSSELGKMEIDEGGAENLIAIARNELKLIDVYKKLEKINSYQGGWEIILRNKIIKGLEGVDLVKDGFKELILNFERFIDATERDYEILVNSTNFETKIQLLENEKYIFADKTRAILQRISGSIISIPVTFIGLAIALRDISERWLMDTFLFITAAYIVFTVYINFLFWSDLNILKSEIINKMDTISMGVPRLYKKSQNMMRPFFTRIKQMKILIVLIIIILVSLFAFVVYQYANTPRIKVILL